MTLEQLKQKPAGHYLVIFEYDFTPDIVFWDGESIFRNCIDDVSDMLGSIVYISKDPLDLYKLQESMDFDQVEEFG